MEIYEKKIFFLASFSKLVTDRRDVVWESKVARHEARQVSRAQSLQAVHGVWISF